MILFFIGWYIYTPKKRKFITNYDILLLVSDMVINRVDPIFYNIIIIVSIIVGIIYILMSLYNEKKLNKNIILFIIMFFVFAIFGGKLYTYVMYDLEDTLMESSLSAYGGLVSVVLASIVYEAIYPTKKRVIKYTILSLPLIYSFTKIGCSLIGCCEGIPYNGPLNITYPHQHAFSLFPIQPLEVIVFFILFIFVNKNKNRKDIEYITLLFIAVLKYLVEFLRLSETSTIINPNQMFSLILFVCTLVVYIINYHIRRHHFSWR